MAARVTVTGLFVLLQLQGIGGGALATELPTRRFEYKYSFKGPHLVHSDGTVPFWIHTGNAIPSADQIRITPSLRSQKGSVWTKSKFNSENWEIEVTFRVTGRGRVGADGLAIWYTADQGLDGPVFGAADLWNGVGIFFDSFDNDGKKNNPVIVVVGNNGQLLYDHQNDGTTQALGSCLRDFRNKPYPVRARIIYYRRTLTVMIHNGFTPNNDDYELCARVENMALPSEGYYGISAATGGLADDHDVLSFLTFRLLEPGKPVFLESYGTIGLDFTVNGEVTALAADLKESCPQRSSDLYGIDFTFPDVNLILVPSLASSNSDAIKQAKQPVTLKNSQTANQEEPADSAIPQEEKEKYREEYENFQQALDKKKEEFQKDHPDMQGEPADLFETVNERELRQIFEGQNRIHLEIKQLNRQLNMILDEQRRYVTLVTDEMSKRGSNTAPQTGQLPQGELDNIVRYQQEVLRHVGELKNSVTNALNQAAQLLPGGATGSYETSQHFHDIKEHLHIVKRDLGALVQRNVIIEKPKCPELPPFPSCLSTTHFFMFVAIQTVLFIGYIMYRSQQEAAAKKFF